MWIAMTDGFVSVVKDNGVADGSGLVVRARRKKHLLNLFGESARHRIIVDEFGAKDYKYRVFASKPEVARIMSERVMDIDYTNFKAQAKKEDEKLAKMYSLWWHDHYEYQR